MMGDLNPMASSHIGNIKNFGGMIQIEKIVVRSTQLYIDFQNIPQDYNHLLIEGIGRNDWGTASFNSCEIYFNNDTGSNYGMQWIISSGSTNTASRALAQTFGYAYQTFGNGVDSTSFTPFFIKIPFYSGTQKKGSLGFSSMNCVGNSGQSFMTTFWNSTAPINRVALKNNVGSSFVAGSQATLYGVM